MLIQVQAFERDLKMHQGREQDFTNLINAQVVLIEERMASIKHLLTKLASGRPGLSVEDLKLVQKLTAASEMTPAPVVNTPAGVLLPTSSVIVPALGMSTTPSNAGLLPGSSRLSDGGSASDGLVVPPPLPPTLSGGFRGSPTALSYQTNQVTPATAPPGTQARIEMQIST